MAEIEDNIVIQEEDLSEILRIRREKLSELQAAGNDPFEIVRFDQTHHSVEIIENFDVLEGKTVAIAGRMMSKRIMGKASFAHIMDSEGQIQAYIRRDDIGEDEYLGFKMLDIGDIIGIKGFVFKTKTVRYPCMLNRYSCFQNRCCLCLKNFMGLRIRICATGSAMLT
jgi:lysyl-tRNA synthetase class II